VTEDIDIDRTLAPKSDQLDAVELSEPRTITITKLTEGSEDQPINVYFEGDGGRPWRPSKTVRRILRECWGNRGSDWVGKSCTIYNDKSVKFGGLEIGGVRVSHASGISNPITMLLPVTRGKFAKYHIQPLVVREMRGDQFIDLMNRMTAATTEDALLAIAKEIGEDASDEQRNQARAAFRARRAELNTTTGETE
jgi:hypothetical protein